MVSGGDQDDDDRVLSPDELAIEEQDEVAAIGEDRYVIGPDGPPSAPADGAAEGGAPQREQPPQGDRGGGNTTEQPPSHRSPAGTSKSGWPRS